MKKWDKNRTTERNKRRNRIRGKEWKRVIERNKKILKERGGECWRKEGECEKSTKSIKGKVTNNLKHMERREKERK